MKVAMLVHNAVLNDPRVTKSAISLNEAGYRVEIHGISQSNKLEKTVLYGTAIEVFLSPAVRPAKMAPLWSRIRRKIFALARRATTRRTPELVHKLVRNQILARYDFLAGLLLESVSARDRPDIVHIHDHVALPVAAALKHRFQSTIVWDAHEIYPALGQAGDGQRKANIQIVEHNQVYIDHFITINDSIANFYRQNFSSLPQATIIKNATIRNDRVAYDGRLHEAAGLPLSQKILLYQGGFSHARGLHHLVAAAGKLDSDWTVVMMGWGGIEKELRDLASSSNREGIYPAVVFIPPSPPHQVRNWTVGATLGIIPYENTGLNHLYCTPNKLWEYPDADVPILCTDLLEIRKTIEDHKFGFLLPRNFTAKDIAEKVNELRDDEIHLAKMNCQNFIAADNWDYYAERLRALYREICTYNDAADKKIV